MFRRLLLLLALLVLLAATVAPVTGAARKPRRVNAPAQLVVPAWTQVRDATYPATGTYNVSAYDQLGGYIGLQPITATSGEVTFTWYNDAGGTQITGVQGFPIHGAIPSLALLSIVNQGDYLRVRFQCLPTVGCTAPLAMRLFGTNRRGRTELAAPDTNLFGEGGWTLAAHTSEALYPTDYWAGPIRLYLDAPTGFTVTIYGFDLLLVPWKLDATGPGGLNTYTPFGAWFVVVSNTTDQAGSYTLSATPDLGGTP